jgi:hypothetical protein
VALTNTHGLIHLVYTNVIEQELRELMKGFVQHSRGNDKVKVMSMLFRPKSRARNQGGRSRRSRKAPDPNYDLIKDPQTDEEVKHNRDMVAYLLRKGLLPFAHQVDGVGLAIFSEQFHLQLTILGYNCRKLQRRLLATNYQVTLLWPKQKGRERVTSWCGLGRHNA